MAVSLTVAGLTKTYGRLTALSDVALTVHDGEVLGLIGPNGAGKTTLFECIAGVLPYDDGTVSMNGRRLSARARASQVFYTPDGIAPWPSQTVGWALDFTIGFFGGPRDRRQQVIEQLDLTSFLGARIATLSKGQRKRTILAIGLLTPHAVLLCDEPFDGLDLRQTRDVGNALRAHAAAGRTLFLSIHQIPDAARVCDRFVLLSAGRVRGEGTLDELAQVSQQPRSLEEIVLALT